MPAVLQPKGTGGEPAEITRTELAERLEELTQVQAQGAPQDRPTELPLGRITTEPAVFKLRVGELWEHHLSDLGQALKVPKDLDPVTVMPCGLGFVLTDGHHRLEAYRRAGRSTIPVRYFEGSPRDARASAIRQGVKAVVPLTTQEKSNLAWQNLLSGAYSLAAIARMVGVSRQTMDNMSKARKGLGERAIAISEWWKAQQALKDLEGSADVQMSPEDWETYERERAAVLADKLRKAFGHKLQRNLNITAHVLAVHLGERLPLLVDCLHQFEYVQGAEEDPDAQF